MGKRLSPGMFVVGIAFSRLQLLPNIRHAGKRNRTLSGFRQPYLCFLRFLSLVG